MADDSPAIPSEDSETFEVLPTDALLCFLRRLAQEEAEERKTTRLERDNHGDE